MKKYAIGRNGKFNIDYDGMLAVYRTENGCVYKRSMNVGMQKEKLFAYADEAFSIDNERTLIRNKNKLEII